MGFKDSSHESILRAHNAARVKKTSFTYHTSRTPLLQELKTIRYSSNSVDYTARRNVLRSLKDGEYIPTSVIQTVAIKIMLRYISFIFGVVSRMRIQFYIFYKKCSVRHERPNSTCCWARCARHNQTSIRRSEKIQGHPHLKKWRESVAWLTSHFTRATESPLWRIFFLTTNQKNLSEIFALYIYKNKNENDIGDRSETDQRSIDGNKNGSLAVLVIYIQ